MLRELDSGTDLFSSAWMVPTLGVRTCKMAGEGLAGEAPRILCSYCKKPAVTKVVKCRNCSNTLHRSCGEKKHLEIGVDNTTICCEAYQLPRDKKMADAVCSGSENRGVEINEEARTVAVTEDIHGELKFDDTASRGGRLLCMNTGFPNADYEGENLEVLRLENAYLKSILLENENTIRDRCSMLLDKDSMNMAPGSAGVQNELQNNCKRCKQPTQNGLKCVVCGVITHARCVKLLKGVKVLDGGQINCCVVINSDGQLNSPSGSVVSQASIEIKYLKEIISHKDIIIDAQSIAVNNQADLIAALKEEIRRLKDNSRSNSSPTKNTPKQTEHNVNTVAMSSGSQQMSGDGQVQGKSSRGKIKTQPSKTADPNIPTAPLHKALEKKTREKLLEVINLETDITTSPTENSDFQLITKRKKKMNKPIIGDLVSDQNCNLRAATTLDHWHVYKFHPDTTEDDVASYLKMRFPEIQVEKLQSRYPASYSSFKVSASQTNRNAITQPSLWPTGVRINRFFLGRRRTADPGK